MTATSTIPGLILAAPRSGAGKTTVAMGLICALSRRGLAVQPFKSGPDYIDPAFHAAAAGRPCFNLDTWAMSRGLIDRIANEAGRGAELAIAEGAMGLFDGVATGGKTTSGSSADLAALTGWPVILILDVSGQGETAAAVALGCAAYRSDIAIAGVVLNRVASKRHLEMVRGGFARTGIAVLGALMRDDALTLPERHLGLVQATETGDIGQRLKTLADKIEASVDLDALIRLAKPLQPIDASPKQASIAQRPPGQRIAVASDRAFAFLYPHIVMQWRGAGADILPFSPLADEAPATDADAIWLPGGYPELHAGTLASAHRVKAGLQEQAARGTPIHGECGGYMVLGRGLVDADGHRHAMAGLLPLETSFAKRRLHLGYRRAQLTGDCLLGVRGAVLYGHEFHYATTLSCGGPPFATCKDAHGNSVAEGGLRRGSVSGTFFHMIDRSAA